MAQFESAESFARAIAHWLVNMVIAGLFGLWFGLVYWRSGRMLWPVVIAHALPDTVSILSGG